MHLKRTRFFWSWSSSVVVVVILRVLSAYHCDANTDFQCKVHHPQVLISLLDQPPPHNICIDVDTADTHIHKEKWKERKRKRKMRTMLKEKRECRRAKDREARTYELLSCGKCNRLADIELRCHVWVCLCLCFSLSWPVVWIEIEMSFSFWRVFFFFFPTAPWLDYVLTEQIPCDMSGCIYCQLPTAKVS